MVAWAMGCCASPGWCATGISSCRAARPGVRDRRARGRAAPRVPGGAGRRVLLSQRWQRCRLVATFSSVFYKDNRDKRGRQWIKQSTVRGDSPALRGAARQGRCGHRVEPRHWQGRLAAAGAQGHGSGHHQQCARGCRADGGLEFEQLGAEVLALTADLGEPGEVRRLIDATVTRVRRDRPAGEQRRAPLAQAYLRGGRADAGRPPGGQYQGAVSWARSTRRR